MAGIRRFKLLLGIFIPFFAFLLMSQNTFADSGSASVADISFWSSAAGQQVTANVNLPWTANVGGTGGADTRQFYLNRINIWYPITASVDSQNVWGRVVQRFELIATPSEQIYFCEHNLSDMINTGDYSNVNTSCTGELVYWFSDGTYYTASSPVYFNLDYPHLNVFTDFSQALPNKELTGITFKVLKTGNYDVLSVLKGFGSLVTIKISDASFFSNSSGGATDISPIVNQNNTIINQDADYYNSNYEATDNIENQSSSDIQGAENAQTTSLINVIGGFISAFSGITAGNCNLTLEFPDYAGGTRVVNICSGKDKAPRIVEIGSSMLLICVFVPLAYILIRMIYNEIRSWTNG